MMRRKHFSMALLIHFILMSAAVFMLAAAGFAAETKSMGGWESDSPYNRLYNPSEMDRIKGTVDKVVEVVPMPGMSPGVALIVQESKSESIVVHLCPAWYIDVNSTGLKKGDPVKIRGAWAEIGGEYVFMASKIKKGDYFELKVRLTKDGKPFWTMSPEEQAREKADP